MAWLRYTFVHISAQGCAVHAQRRAPAKLVIGRRIRQGAVDVRRPAHARMTHDANDFHLPGPVGHGRCSIDCSYKTLWRCTAMTRTLGAALGVAIVLLFFASLTFEQNRVLTIARATMSSHR
jgi:hypothetical protein